MGINKAFVVKNSLEVSSNLILANSTTRKVGIGSTSPQYTLDVRGGIGATDFYLTGIGTFVNELNVGLGGTVLTVLGIGNSIGIGTALPGYLLDIRSPVSTGQTALYVQGDVRITGDLNLDDVFLDDAQIQDLTVTDTLFVAGVSTFNSNAFINAALNVSGITTLGGYVDINNSVDISGALNVVGLTTLGGYVDINNSVDISGALNVSGLSTFAGITTHTASVFGTNLSLSGVGTIPTLNSTSGTITNLTGTSGTITNLTGTNLSYSGISTLGVTTATNLTLQRLNVSGVSTLGTVQISSGIITATSGIVTYYGDGQFLSNVTRGVGLGTTGGIVGYGATILYFQGPGISTVTVASGIATINITGGGSGSASIGIGSTPGAAFTGIITAGNLWYNTNLGRMFIYYQDIDSAQWVDAAPFNVGIITSLTNVSFAPGSAISPSMYFIGDPTTGFFSPTSGQTTFVSIGASVLNINPNGIRVTGIVTATDFDSLSDINYKKNIETVNDALNKVEQLRGVRFDWKESGAPSYGVIAQELEEVLPELVHGNDPKTVNYNGIIGVLIESIKELKAEIEELKNTK